MRASRLLSILMLLQTRGRLSAATLSRELEVSTRTVLRDIDHLSASGVPVWSDRGRDGGFQLREGWRTALTGLTAEEANALSLAGMPAAATALGLGAASTSAHLKMLASLPDTLRDDASRVSTRLHIDPIDWYRAHTPPTHLQAVAQAVWKQQQLAIDYQSWAGLKKRTIKPLGLVLKGGIWYVVALAEKAKTARTYRLSNILTLTANKATFTYPRGFRLATFWEDAARTFETDRFTDTATIRLNEQGIARLNDLREIPAAAKEAAMQIATPDPRKADWVRLTLPIESIDHAAKQFIALGADIEILAPITLRKRMRETIARMIKMYAAKSN
jgi:predicted DNA-binding transcriptional regulator YafY